MVLMLMDCLGGDARWRARRRAVRFCECHDRLMRQTHKTEYRGKGGAQQLSGGSPGSHSTYLRRDLCFGNDLEEF